MEAQEILSAYSEHVIEHNARPNSMAAFAKKLEISESHIYKYYANFKKMESEIFKHFIDNAIELADKNAENSEHQDSRESLLTFYFTLTEVLKANRSLVVFMLPGDRTSISQLHLLKSAKSSFLNFIKKLDLETPALSFIPDHKMKDKALETGAWMQFCSILLYWLKDTSPDFEKTDVFIEKSLKLSFDLAESNVMESMVDLGKFMFGKS
ncbi:MAG: AcrR family transcriptional regulator [Crocinitomicaceae bacterium]|jgi:AcrR family transcriptional regulator